MLCGLGWVLGTIVSSTYTPHPTRFVGMASRGAQGPNETYVISPQEQHGFRFCKALYDDQGHHWRAHTKFQKSNGASGRADMRYSSFCPPVPTQREGGAMVIMPYLRTAVVELSSETSHSASSNITNWREVLQRSLIDGSGADISPLWHLSAGGRPHIQKSTCFKARS